MTTKQELITWLKSPNSNRVVLVEIHGVITDTGTVSSFYLSNKPFISQSTDVPSNTSYTAVISGGITFSESLSLDGSPTLGVGDIELDNRNNVANGDTWLKYIWQNKLVNIFIGDVTWPKADFYQIFTGLVRDIDTNSRNTINLLLVNRLEKLNIAISEKVIGGTAANNDQLIPLSFGECFNITPLLIDSSTLTYQVHDGPIERIIEVRDNGAPITTFTPDLATGKFTLTTSPFGTITASVQGYKRAGVYQSEIGQIINSILLDYVKDTATYTLTASTPAVNEGQTVVFSLYTTGIANSTTVPYTISGVTLADITSPASLTGNFTVQDNKATLSITLTEDLLTEGTEPLTVTLTNRPEVTSAVVIDTSINSIKMFFNPANYTTGTTWTDNNGVTFTLGSPAPTKNTAPDRFTYVIPTGSPVPAGPAITTATTLTYTQGFSFNAWIRPTSTGQSNNGRIVDKTSTSAADLGFYLALTSPNTGATACAVSCKISATGNIVQTTSDLISFNTWHNVLVTISANGSVVIYRNAQNITSGTTGAPSNITASQPLRIGNYSSLGNRTFGGDIGIIKFYDRALTAQECLREFNLHKSTYGVA